ncbi:MAG: glycosyltransferase family 2 protein [Acidobacteria bacterium]|nr:glycosyltransferase family 2 protein [Acidobacteriota bacterium]MBI3428049.1 glycosyltransferase family 2 protein [Acidobacteriota bacterium]
MNEQTNKLPLSVIVPVKNEAQNLAACLISVAWADEIWVVDSHSTDGTVELAKQLGAQVAQFEYAGGFPKKKNWALANLALRNEWVLLLDADERVTPALETEIRALLNGPNIADGYYINRKLIFLERWIKHCGWYPSWNMRLFKHRLGRYEKLAAEDVEQAGDVEVHEHVVLAGRAAYLKHDLLHEDFKSIFHFIERHNRYSNWEARVYANFARGQRGESSIGAALLGSPLERKRLIKQWWARLPCRPILRFLWMYVFRLGFLDGKPGLIFCTLMTMHEAVIGAKLYEQTLLPAQDKLQASRNKVETSLER